MKNLWIDITALVYSLGFRSVNALEDALVAGEVVRTESVENRLTTVDHYLGEVGAARLAFASFA